MQRLSVAALKQRWTRAIPAIKGLLWPLGSISLGALIVLYAIGYCVDTLDSRDPTHRPPANGSSTSTPQEPGAPNHHREFR